MREEQLCDFDEYYDMKTILLSLMVAMLVASCTKSDSANNNTKHSSLLGTITVDIDGVSTSFDSVPVCTYLTKPLTSNIIINGYKKNDTSNCNIQLMISGSDSITDGTYFDSVSALNSFIFSPSYTPPNFISSFSGDRSNSLEPEIKISFIKDSIQGTFDGRLINILYQNSLPDTSYHQLTNGKFKIKMNHSSNGV